MIHLNDIYDDFVKDLQSMTKEDFERELEKAKKQCEKAKEQCKTCSIQKFCRQNNKQEGK